MTVRLRGGKPYRRMVARDLPPISPGACTPREALLGIAFRTHEHLKDVAEEMGCSSKLLNACLDGNRVAGVIFVLEFSRVTEPEPALYDVNDPRPFVVRREEWQKGPKQKQVRHVASLFARLQMVVEVKRDAKPQGRRRPGRKQPSDSTQR